MLGTRTTDASKIYPIGLINFGAFGVFSAELSALFCHWFWFSGLTHINPKYYIGRKEFGKWPSHVRRRWSKQNHFQTDLDKRIGAKFVFVKQLKPNFSIKLT